MISVQHRQQCLCFLLKCDQLHLIHDCQALHYKPELLHTNLSQVRTEVFTTTRRLVYMCLHSGEDLESEELQFGDNLWAIGAKE